MDVPEASKHAKKSTSQKLEDQKKVGKTLLFSPLPFRFFFHLLPLCVCVLPWLSSCMQVEAVDESLFIAWFVVLFTKRRTC